MSEHEEWHEDRAPMQDDDDALDAARLTADTRLQARLWNAVPDLPADKRRMAESIAGSERITRAQRRAAYGLLGLTAKKVPT